MLFLANMLEYISENFNNFYNKLNEAGQLIFWIVVILVVILFILLIIVLQQKSISKKLVNEYAPKMEPKQTNVDAETLDIDLENEKTRNLKEITDKLQAVIDSKAIPLTSFEEDQEENSIISYKELMRASKEKEVKKVEAPKWDSFDEKPKFKSSEFISPIFGVQNGSAGTKPLTRPEAQKMEPIMIEPKKENISINLEEEEYLNSLKQFRNNLN